MQPTKLSREARRFFAAMQAAQATELRNRVYFSQRRNVRKLRGVPTSIVLGLDKE